MADVKDKKADFTVFNYDGGNFRAHIGGTRAVGDGELRDVVGGVLNVNKRDNDIKDILSELLLGRTDKAKESDGVAGISGVELVGLDQDSFTITLENGRGVKDTIVFQGEGVAKIIEEVAEMSGGVDVKDNRSAFEIITVDADNHLYVAGSDAPKSNVHIGGTSGELNDIVGGSGIGINNNANDVERLVDEIVTGSNDSPKDTDADPDNTPGIDGVELIDLDMNSFAVQTQKGDATDTILFVGEGVANAIASVAGQADIKNSASQLEIIDVTGTVNEHIGGTNGELNQVIGGKINVKQGVDDVASLVDELTTGTGGGDGAPGIDNVRLIGLDGDSVTVEISQRGDAPDIIVFSNDADDVM